MYICIVIADPEDISIDEVDEVMDDAMDDAIVIAMELVAIIVELLGITIVLAIAKLLETLAPDMVPLTIESLAIAMFVIAVTDDTKEELILTLFIIIFESISLTFTDTNYIYKSLLLSKSVHAPLFKRSVKSNKNLALGANDFPIRKSRINKFAHITSASPLSIRALTER